jgi:hypothetical protein
MLLHGITARACTMMQRAQLVAGVALGSSAPGVLSFTDTMYLSHPTTSLGTCVTLTPSVAAPAATTIDLEAAGAAACSNAGITCVGGNPPVTPLTDLNQGSTNMCSSMAFAQGYTVKAALTGLRSPAQLSAVYAYYYQRVEECATTGACPCRTCKTCKPRCEPPCADCGSYFTSAISVFEDGVAAAAAWPNTQALNATPSAAAQAAASAHKITRTTCIEIGASIGASCLAALQANNPIVLFLKITPAIMSWFQSLVNYVVPAGASAASVVLPSSAIASSSAASSGLGHAVLLTGYDAATASFIIRNSFGFAWAVGGRFAIRVADMTPALIYMAVVIDAVE